MSGGMLIIFTGPSGVGKGTVMRELLRRMEGRLELSVSSTTRAQRPRERAGVDYNYVTRARFIEDVRQGRMMEYAEYGGNLYGTPAQPVDRSLRAGRHVALEIEVDGARQVMAKRPDAISIFLMPPSFDELRRRLSKRGTETPEALERRLNRALDEMKAASEFTYLVVNRRVDCAADDIMAVIRAEELKYINRNKVDEVVLYALSGSEQVDR